jgi:ribosomal protein S12 methylthiotransferase accessory factor
MCEVVERDALSIADAIDNLAPVVAGLCLEGETDNSLDREFVPSTLGRRIALATLPPVAKVVVGKMERAGLRVCLRDATAAIGVATLECTCIERRPDGGGIAHGGCGSHPDARVAVLRALTEAAQSRVAHIQGGREDLAEIIGRTVPLGPNNVSERGDSVSFATIPTVENANIDDDIRYLLKRLADEDFDQVVVVDLTREELGVPVVRVVIPQAETWSFLAHYGTRAELGDRANHALSKAVARCLESGVRSRSPEASQPLHSPVR